MSRRVTITIMCLLLPQNARVCQTHSYQSHYHVTVAVATVVTALDVV